MTHFYRRDIFICSQPSITIISIFFVTFKWAFFITRDDDDDDNDDDDDDGLFRPNDLGVAFYYCNNVQIRYQIKFK